MRAWFIKGMEKTWIISVRLLRVAGIVVLICAFVLVLPIALFLALVRPGCNDDAE
jgi:hypothetical protein